MKRLICLFLWFLGCLSAFIRTHECSYDSSLFNLAPFVVDVRLAEDERLLKFLISSKVVAKNDNSSSYGNLLLPNRYVGIIDINSTTNTYTTLAVNIDFKGELIISERLRFCDYVAVKNTTGSTVDPRLPSYIPQGFHQGFDPGDSPNSRRNQFADAFFLGKNYNDQLNSDNLDVSHKSDPTFDYFQKRDDSYTDFNSIAGTNVSLSSFFKNVTGQLMQCPLYINDSILIYYEANITGHFHKFGSYAASFTVINSDESGTVLGCASMYVTPIQPKTMLNAILYGVIILLVVTSLVNLFTIVNSSYQESTNPFLYKASTFCNTKLLKQLDANVTRIIIYLQFALFIGGLDLQYPGFYQPLISQLRWAALLGITLIGFKNSDFDIDDKSSYFSRGNIYNTLNWGGIKSLTSFTYNPANYGIWSNFMLSLVIWLGIQISAQELFLLAKYTGDKLVKRFRYRHKDSILNDSGFQFTITNNFYFILGQFFNTLLHLFAVPFIVMTSYMFEASANTLNKTRYIPSIQKLQQFSFSFTTPYDAIDARGCNFSLAGEQESNSSPEHHFNASDACLASKVKGMPLYEPIIGSFIFALWFILAFYFVFHYLITVAWPKLVRSNRISRLYTSLKTILLWSFLYHDYHPDKAYYAGIDLLMLALKSIVVGALQNHGSIQVILLIIFEFIDLVALFLIQPYFIGLPWTSPRCWIPMAKFLVTVLCIPYIRDLKLSEATRTYVAYVQLSIHAVVALIFTMQLIYCFVITIMSIQSRKSENELKDEGEIKTVDDFEIEFEYKPMNYHGTSKPKYTDENHTDEEVDNADSYYYRGRTNTNSRPDSGILDLDLTCESLDNNANQHFRLGNRVEYESPFTSEELPIKDLASLNDSFTNEAQFSNLRKLTTNYCVREGDNVYNKYFIDDTIDPEVKALWAKRNLWENAKDSKKERSTFVKKAEKFIPKSLFFKTLPTESGFQVSRPRKLVVRSLSEIEENKKMNSRMDSESASSMDDINFAMRN